MSKIVIDSSVVIKWFLDEEDSDKAQSIYDDHETGTLNLIAPDLMNIEIGNIIWKHVVHRGMSEEDAQDVMDRYIELELNLVPTTELLYEAYKIAVTYKRSVYDSTYVALSIQEGCQFVTADEKLYNAVGKALPNVALLANWA